MTTLTPSTKRIVDGLVTKLRKVTQQETPDIAIVALHALYHEHLVSFARAALETERKDLTTVVKMQTKYLKQLIKVVERLVGAKKRRKTTAKKVVRTDGN